MAAATAAAKKDVEEFTFQWEGVDRANKIGRAHV